MFSEREHNELNICGTHYRQFVRIYDTINVTHNTTHMYPEARTAYKSQISNMSNSETLINQYFDISPCN